MTQSILVLIDFIMRTHFEQNSFLLIFGIDRKFK